MKRQLRRENGVGLIEILVALVLISVGFLATASMQINSLRVSQSTYYQSQAYFMANEIIDRMRVNIDGVNAGLYDDKTTLSTLTNPNCHSSACTPAQVAEQDLFDWSGRLHDVREQTNFTPALPSSTTIPAKGAITASEDGVYTITISWSEPVNDTDTEQTLSIEFVAEIGATALTSTVEES